MKTAKEVNRIVNIHAESLQARFDAILALHPTKEELAIVARGPKAIARHIANYRDQLAANISGSKSPALEVDDDICELAAPVAEGGGA